MRGGAQRCILSKKIYLNDSMLFWEDFEFLSIMYISIIYDEIDLYTNNHLEDSNSKETNNIVEAVVAKQYSDCM